MESKGLAGTRGVGTKQENWGSVRSKSVIRVLRLTKRIPCSVKCKCLQRIAVRPSKKSYATRGTRAPSK